MKRHSLGSVLFALVFLALVVPVSADGFIIPLPRPERPVPFRDSLSIKYHRVTVDIEDQAATTHVDQVFVNEMPYDIEGEYIFPLPEGASISQFAMWVDGKRLEAQVLNRDEAREIYEDIVRQQRDPALLEYIGRNAFRARIYPIPARGEKRVELEYTQVLPQDQGLIEYVYPLNTEKFSARPLEQASVSVRITSRQPLKSIYSPSHEVAVHRVSDLIAEVGYEESNVTPDKDFVLYYSANEDDLGINLLSYKEPGQDGFFLMLLAPRVERGAHDVVAKDVFFVLDTSGSMRGDKLAQAKRAARYVLQNLNSEDRFSIVTFSTGIRLYEDGLKRAAEAERAYPFISELQAGGGTNISRALEEALAQTQRGRPQSIIFLTDGLATEGERDTAKILRKVGNLAADNVSIFAFGVGYDVDTTLLDKVTQNHHGTSVYVRPDEDIERAVSSFYEKISTPILTGVSVDFGKVRVEDTYPYPLPDLFAGSQLVMVGRYRQADTTTVVLEGAVNGRPTRYAFEDIRFRVSDGAEFVPRLWATRKIGYLLTQIRLNGVERELVDEIVELSVRYGIITPYTSFLIDETEDALTSDGRRVIAEREFRVQGAPALEAGKGGGGAIPAPAVSGQVAVEKSVAQSSLRDAEVAPEPQEEALRTVGSKAFVYRQGVWTDTTFDARSMVVDRIAFGGSRYFELLRDHEEWARYLALGPRVILVWQGQAYQIDSDGSAGTASTETETGTKTNPTPLPTQANPAQATKPEPTAIPKQGLWELLSGWLDSLLG